MRYHWFAAIAMVFPLAVLADAGQWPVMPASRMLEPESGLPVVLTPARLRQAHAEVPASVTVIDRELIQASGARELYEVLRLVPGFNAVKTDGNVPAAAYHGTHARDIRRMLVLVDGRSVYLPGLARVLWNNIGLTPEDVERIEITRGPNAAAYGANAFSGVINIITRDPRDESGHSATWRQGNNGIRDARLHSTVHSGRAAVRITGARLSDDGFDGDDYREPADHKQLDFVNFRANFEQDAQTHIELLAGVGHSRLDRPEESALSDLGQTTRVPEEVSDQGYVHVRWQRLFSEDHQLKVQAYTRWQRTDIRHHLCAMDPVTQSTEGPGGALFFSRELRDIFEASDRDIDVTMENAAVALGTPDSPLLERYMSILGSGADDFCLLLPLDIDERSFDVEVEDTLHVGNWLRIVTGVNLRRDEANSQAYTRGDNTNTAHRLFGALEIRPAKRLSLHLGGFWEKDDINDRFFSPRGAVVLQVAPGHGLRVVYSEAIRSPDIYEQRADFAFTAHRLAEPFATDSQSLLGWKKPELYVTRESPGGLEAERIRSREIGYVGRFSALDFDVRIYEENLRDLQSGALSPARFDITSDWVDTRGWELQASWRPHPRHFLWASYGHRQNDTSTHIESRLAPRKNGSALWAFNMSRDWHFSSAWYFARHYNRARSRSTDTTYERLMTQLGWRHHMGAYTVGVRLANEHQLSRDGEVYPYNVYDDHNRWWLQARLDF